MFGAYKSFIVISVLGLATFWMANQNIPEFIRKRDVINWQKLWFILLIIASFSLNVWVFYALFALTIVIHLPKKPENRIYYYLFLLCALPQFYIIIPSIAGLPWLFPMTYSRMAVLTILLFIYFKTPAKPKLFQLKSDKYVIWLLTLMMLLKFRDDTITNGLRQSFLIFIDFFIPYFILSRHISDTETLKKALYALILGLLPLAVIGLFETIKTWLLFGEMYMELLDKGIGYQMRAGSLRATASTSGGPVLGFIMVISFGLLLYLKPYISNKKIILLGGIIIISCLLVTKARGPWLGLIVLVSAYLYTGPAGIRKIIKYSLLSLSTLPILLLTPTGQRFIDLLPFIGTTRADTITYRERLIDNSWIVFQQNPWFGSSSYLETPEMRSMVQGEGIIDIVNSYIQIALEYGSVGLSFFLLILFTLLWRNRKIIKRLPSTETDLIHIGRVLFAVLASIIFMIFTVSSVNYIPIAYWAFFGLIAAYLKICDQVILNNKNSPNLTT